MGDSPRAPIQLEIQTGGADKKQKIRVLICGRQFESTHLSDLSTKSPISVNANVSTSMPANSCARSAETYLSLPLDSIRPLRRDHGNQRRGGDSNPRCGVTRTHAFQACTFSHSDTSPGRPGLGEPDRGMIPLNSSIFARGRQARVPMHRQRSQSIWPNSAVLIQSRKRGAAWLRSA